MSIDKFSLLILLLFFALPSLVQAQFISKSIIIGDTSQVHILSTENGDRFVGRVTKIENTNIFFLFKETKELEFTLTEIRSIVLEKEQVVEKQNNPSAASSRNADYLRAKAEYEARRNGQRTYSPKSKSTPQEENYRRAKTNYQNKRSGEVILNGEETLFFSPTSYTLGKGQKEFRNVMLLYNRLDFGVTDNIDLGFDLLPLITANFFSARMKAGIPLSDFLNIGFGASWFFFIQPNSFQQDVSGTTHTYGTATFGNRDKFINIGYGYAFPFRPEEEMGSSLLTFGGALRISKRWKLMADFILLGTDDEPDFYSIGASWFNNKHRFDFGINTLATPENSFFGPAVPIPFASYALSFGRN